MKEHGELFIKCPNCKGKGYRWNSVIPTLNRIHVQMGGTFLAQLQNHKIYCDDCEGTGYLPVYIKETKEATNG